MSTVEPRVSVIIPVYNSMPYLTDTLQSLLNQDLAPGELQIIAVDDGSTDGSGEELDRFAALDDRVSVIHQPNSGWPGMPRNKGMDRATGRYLFFMDSDDTAPSDAMRTLADDADLHDADVVIPRMEGTGGRGVQGVFFKHPSGPITVSRAMETLSPQKLFRRSFIEDNELRFPEGKVRLEDGMFVAKAYVLASRIDILTQKPLYFIHQRDDGQNISSRPIDAAGYDNSVRVIGQILRDGTPDEQQSDRLVLELFTRKGLRWYGEKRWFRMRPQRQEEWFALHQAFVADEIPAGLELTAERPGDVEKLKILRSGTVDDMRLFMQAGVDLAHTSTLTAARALRGAYELRVRLSGAFAQGAVTHGAGLAGVRTRGADLFSRLTAPLQGSRVARGFSRRVEHALDPHGPGVQLELAGRTSGQGFKVSARGAARRLATDAVEVRFVLSSAQLQRLRGQIVDVWTVALSPDAVTGPRSRLAVEEHIELPKEPGVRVYATVQGNLSFDLRKK